MTIEVPEELMPRGSVPSAPPRRPGSVRRTVTMDFTWPDGLAGNTMLDARARDLRTGGDGTAAPLAAASLGLVSDSGRTVREIKSDPGLPGLADLAGQVDAFFQDSSTLPEGGRQSIHEYTLTAQADLDTGTVRAVTPVPRVLPYRECPLAVGNTGALAGLPMGELRGAVLEQLRGPLGCTHLNDMLRALAAVPALARQLQPARGR